MPLASVCQSTILRRATAGPSPATPTCRTILTNFSYFRPPFSYFQAIPGYSMQFQAIPCYPMLFQAFPGYSSQLQPFSVNYNQWFFFFTGSSSAPQKLCFQKAASPWSQRFSVNSQCWWQLTSDMWNLTHDTWHPTSPKGQFLFPFTLNSKYQYTSFL